MTKKTNMSKQWICSTDESHIFNEPTSDLFCPHCRNYGGILMPKESDINNLGNGAIKDNSISKKENPKNKRKIISAIGLILSVSILFFFIYSKHNEKKYNEYTEIGYEAYELTKYEDAKRSYLKALDYIQTDSISKKVEMLEELIPAMQLFYDAKYNEAFDKFKIASSLGSGDADYYLGELTYNGLGTIKDYNVGWEYSNQAIKKGFKMAYWRIAYAYQNGKGVEKDVDKADRYYLEAIEAMKKLAEAGDPEALGNLGSMYSSGSGVAKNEKIAFDYYLKSANLGYAFIQANLAMMFEYGTGTEINLEEALKWYQKSAEKGHPTSLLGLGNMYIEGKGVTKNISKGLDLIKQAADQNYSRALSKLGYIYFVGEIVPENKSISFEFTKKAVDYDNDNITAIENLAYNYKTGSGTAINYNLAKKYYEKAIKQDETSAGRNYYRIALLYYEGGNGLEKSESEFLKYCKISEEKNYSDARELLGIFYNKKGMEFHNNNNYSEARRYFELASSKGNTSANNNLTFMNNYNQ